jgi:hypothetical protein
MTNLVFKPSLARVTRNANPSLNLEIDVPTNCDSYVFYVPGMIEYEELKKTLLQHGEKTGTNLFVGAWRLDAEDLKAVLRKFDVKDSPAVIIFGNPLIATDGKSMKTVYARIDNKRLLNDLPKAVESINGTSNLFMRNEFKRAMTEARNDEWRSSFSYYLEKAKAATKEFLDKHSVTFDILNGQVILSPVNPQEEPKKKSDTEKANGK